MERMYISDLLFSKMDMEWIMYDFDLLFSKMDMEQMYISD